MTQEQAEYLVCFDAREFTSAGAVVETRRQVAENLSREISPDEMEELVGNYPDFPRNNE